MTNVTNITPPSKKLVKIQRLMVTNKLQITPQASLTLPYTQTFSDISVFVLLVIEYNY